MAESSYEASILSAREHRFYQEEALALELYGVYLVETNRPKKGLEQLETAVTKYNHWGCTTKVRDVKDFIECITATTSLWKIEKNGVGI